MTEHNVDKENNRIEEIVRQINKKRKFKQADKQVLRNITQSVLNRNLQEHDIINNQYSSFIFEDQSKRSSNTNDIKQEVWVESSYSNKKYDDLNKKTHKEKP